jgi:hypothetical protein
MIGGLLKSASGAALFAALGLYAAGGVTPAKAADLGGDCCADLEERVAELEATVARKGNRRMSLTISGQVSTAVMAWDAGGSIKGADGTPESFKTDTTTVTTTTTTVGAPVFTSADTSIAPDALPLKCNDAGVGGAPNAGNAALIGCADPAHVNPPHVHADHTHTATSTSTSTSTSTTTKKAAVAAKPSGKARDVYIVDNVMSGGSYFALTGDAKINPNLSAGFNLTVAFDTGGRSHQVSQFDDDGQSVVPTASTAVGGYDTFMVVTLANWWLDHKQLGKVSVGRINTATAGITTIDLGGAAVIANSSIGYAQRGFTAVGGANNLSWANLLGGNTVNGSGLSRAQAISYSTPVFGGFSASAAWGENDVWDVALRYAGEFSGFRLAAGIGYINNSSGLGDVTEDPVSGNPALSTQCAADPGCKPSQVKGSASILHVATGLYLTGAYVKQDNDSPGRDDTTMWYLNGGIAKNWTGLGNTVLYGEYARVTNALDNFGTSGATFIANTDSTLWGLGVVQNIDAAAMELFLSYKNFSADVPGQDIKDFDVVMGGARIKF